MGRCVYTPRGVHTTGLAKVKLFSPMDRSFHNCLFWGFLYLVKHVALVPVRDQDMGLD